MSENMGASTSGNSKGLHGLYRDSFTYFKNAVYNNIYVLLLHVWTIEVIFRQLVH
jgi:hypothetical protein